VDKHSLALSESDKKGKKGMKGYIEVSFFVGEQTLGVDGRRSHKKKGGLMGEDRSTWQAKLKPCSIKKQLATRTGDSRGGDILKVFSSCSLGKREGVQDLRAQM